MNEAGCTSASTPADSGLLRAMMAHWIHQDRLLWSRIQTLMALQGAVLAGAFVLRASWLGPALLLLGAALTTLVLAFTWNDLDDRDQNARVLDSLMAALAPPSGRVLPSPPSTLRLTAHRPSWRRWVRARRVVPGVMLFFTLLDLGLAVLQIWAPSVWPAA